MYSQNLGIEVVVGGDRAYTNGSRTVIPGYSTLTNNQVNTCLGYIVHESFHNRITDFEPFQTGSPYLNLFEDHRIEREAEIELPGSKQWFQNLDDQCYSPTPVEELHNFTNAQLVNSYLMRAGSKITMNRDTDTETLLHVKSLIEANIDPQVILDLDQALLKSKHTQSTEECFQLSKQLVETLSKYDPQQQDNDQPDDQCSEQSGNQSGDQTANQPGEQAGDQPGDQTANQPGEHAGDQPGDQTANQPGEQAGNQPGDQAGNQTGGTLNKSAIDNSLVKEVMDKTDSIEALLSEMTENQETSTEMVTVADSGGGFTDSTHTSESLSVAQHNVSISNIKREIAAVFEAEAKTQKVVKKKGTRLKHNRLHRIAVKNPKVFEKKIKHHNAEFDVTLVLDASGSMQNDIEEATSVAASFLEGIDAAKNCSFSFLAFPNRPNAYHKRGARLETNLVTSIVAGGGSPIVRALDEATNELSASRNKKVIICITDMVIDESTAYMIRDIVTGNSDINYVWIGVNTKFRFPIPGHVLDQIKMPELANAVKSLKDKLVA